MPQPTDLPIVVGPSAIPDTIKSILRQMLVVVITFAAGRGWVSAENVEGLVTFGVGLVTLGWGLYATFQRKSQLIITAEHAPDSIAKVTK